MGTFSGTAAKKHIYVIRVDALGATGTLDMAAFRATFTGVITKVTYVADAAITGANTNTRKLSVINKGAAGSGTTVIASLQFNSTVNATAFVEKTITLSGTAANLDVVENAIITVKSEAVGTGIAEVGGIVIIEFAKD